VTLLYFQLKRRINLRALLIFYIILAMTLALLSWAFAAYEEQLKEADRIRLAVVNEDTHLFAGVLVDSFKDNSHFTSLFELTFSTHKEAEQLYAKGEIDAYVHIPKGFTQGLLTYDNLPVTIIAHVENPVKNRLIEEILTGYAYYIDAANAATWSLYFTMEDSGMPSETLQRINNSFSLEMISATMGRASWFELDPQYEIPSVSALTYFTIMLPMGVLTLLGLQSGSMSIEDRKDLCHWRLYTTGLSMTFQVLTTAVVDALYAFIFLFPLMLVLFTYNTPSLALWAIGMLVLGTLFWQSSWRLVSYTFKDPSTFSLAITSAAFFIALTSGTLVPFAFLPIWIRQIGSFLPPFILGRSALMGYETIHPYVYTIACLCLVFLVAEALLLRRSFRKGGAL
jgi:hypothetical protein